MSNLKSQALENSKSDIVVNNKFPDKKQGGEGFANFLKLGDLASQRYRNKKSEQQDCDSRNKTLSRYDETRSETSNISSESEVSKNPSDSTFSPKSSVANKNSATKAEDSSDNLDIKKSSENRQSNKNPSSEKSESSFVDKIVSPENETIELAESLPESKDDNDFSKNSAQTYFGYSVENNSCKTENSGNKNSDLENYTDFISVPDIEDDLASSKSISDQLESYSEDESLVDMIQDLLKNNNQINNNNQNEKSSQYSSEVSDQDNFDVFSVEKTNIREFDTKNLNDLESNDSEPEENYIDEVDKKNLANLSTQENPNDKINNKTKEKLGGKLDTKTKAKTNDRARVNSIAVNIKNTANEVSGNEVYTDESYTKALSRVTSSSEEISVDNLVLHDKNTNQNLFLYSKEDLRSGAFAMNLNDSEFTTDSMLEVQKIALNISDIFNRGEKKLSVILYPERLGKVDIEIKSINNSITQIKITTHNKDSYDLVASEIGVLGNAIKELAAEGTKLNLELNDNNQQENTQNQFNNGENAQNQNQRQEFIINDRGEFLSVLNNDDAEEVSVNEQILANSAQEEAIDIRNKLNVVA